MLGAGGVVGASVLSGGIPMAADITELLNVTQRDISLINITTPFGTILSPWADPSILPNLQQMERFVLDALLGIGQQTLPEFMDPHGTTTLQTLFDGWGRLTSDNFTLGGTTPSTMTDVFNAMGLNNIDVSAILPLIGMTPSETVSSALTTAGLDNVTLDDLFNGFNISDSTTLATLVDDLGAGSMTVGTILTDLGVGNGVTLDNLMTGLALTSTTNAGQLEGFLPLLGLTPTQSVWSALAELSGSHITSATTVSSLLDPGTPSHTGEGLLGFIGGMTLGKALGFNVSTTVSSVLEGLKFDTPSGTLTTLGDFTLTQLLGQIQITPGESLSAVLSSLPLGTGDTPSGSVSTTLGTTTLASFLGVLDKGHTVDESTTITQFLDNAGMGSQSIDTLLDVQNVDISNWFIPNP